VIKKDASPIISIQEVLKEVVLYEGNHEGLMKNLARQQKIFIHP